MLSALNSDANFKILHGLSTHQKKNMFNSTHILVIQSIVIVVI